MAKRIAIRDAKAYPLTIGDLIIQPCDVDEFGLVDNVDIVNNTGKVIGCVYINNPQHCLEMMAIILEHFWG